MKINLSARIGLSFVLLAIIAVIDLNTSAEITLAPLYAIPLIVFAYQRELSFNYSIAMAIFVPAVWSTIDYFMHPYSHEIYHILTFVFKMAICIGAVKGIQQYLLVNELNKLIKKKKVELAVSNEALSQSNKELNRFIGMAAHDVRNPIGSILMIVELLKADKSISNESLEMLNLIDQTAKHSLEIISDTLNISKIQSGTIDLHLEKTNYIELVRRNIQINQFLAEQKKQKLIFECAETEVDILLDKSRIKQVLNNLITNAVKYSHKETEIIVKVELNGKNIKTTIIDRGLGIDEKFHEHLFDPYTTTNNVPTNNESKTGLGLAIVKKIVELHNGTIGFTSKVGEGSSFYFELPLSKSN